MTLPIQWIFFDVGHTLLDETPAWSEQFERLAGALRAVGTHVSVQQIKGHYERCCAEFAPRQWHAVVEAVAPDRVPELMSLATGWRHDLERPYPGVKEMLANLAGHYRLGVIANQSLGTRERMAKHGLLEHLSLVMGSAEAGVAKPDPRIFEMALRQADCPPGSAVMVGDRLDNDVRPANLLGMKTVHVRQGGSGAQRAREDDETPTLSLDAIGALTPSAVRSFSGEP